MVEDILKGDAKLFFSPCIQLRDYQAEEFFNIDLLIGLLLFGKLVAKSFDECGHS